MIEAFLNLIFYVGLASIIAWAYKMIAGLLGGLIFFILRFVFLKRYDDETLLAIHPKFFISFGIISHTIVGSIYAYIISLTTFYFIFNYRANYWFYLLLALIWGYTVIFGSQSMLYRTLLWSAVGGILTLMLFPYGPLFFVYEILVLGIGVAYYFGRIEQLQGQQDYYDI